MLRENVFTIIFLSVVDVKLHLKFTFSKVVCMMEGLFSLIFNILICLFSILRFFILKRIGFSFGTLKHLCELSLQNNFKSLSILLWFQVLYCSLTSEQIEKDLVVKVFPYLMRKKVLEFLWFPFF